jgi:hypothetical protein
MGRRPTIWAVFNRYLWAKLGYGYTPDFGSNCGAKRSSAHINAMGHAYPRFLRQKHRYPRLFMRPKTAEVNFVQSIPLR